MSLSGTQTRFEVVATANSSAVSTTGGFTIGTPISSITHTVAPSVAYSLAMNIQTGQSFVLDTATGAITGTVVAGTAQVETATIVAASGATTAGNLNVTVTSALVTGSPLVVPVALTLADNTAALVAAKVRTALGATTAITDHYTVGGSSATYSLTTKATIHAPNDTTLNLAHANDTSAGITTAATSTNTTAGVGTNRCFKFTGQTWDATDFEGQALPAMDGVSVSLIRSSSASASVLIEYDTDKKVSRTSPFVALEASTAGVHPWSNETVTFTATGTILIYLDIHATE